MSDLTKLTVNLTAKAEKALRKASRDTGDSETDVVNRAIQVYALALTEPTLRALLTAGPADGAS